MSEEMLSLYVLISMVIFLILTIGVIIFLARSQHKVNKLKLIEKEKELTFQRALLQNTIKTQETERSRIASELHDDIGSKLNIIHLNLHLLKKGKHLSFDDLTLIDQIETSLSTSINRTRSISHELMPQILRKFGIYHALKELAHTVNIAQSVYFDIKNEHLLKIKDEFKLLHIYRIVQELLQNTLKYASAKNVNLMFMEEDDYLIIEYKDDGVGFDIAENNDGLGLSNIQTRAKLLEGTATIKSLPVIDGMVFTLKILNNG